MIGRLAMTCLVTAVLLAPGLASADPPCGRGWRKHEYCGGGYVYAPPAYVVRPPAYYAPPPVYYAPPPPVYYAPPVVVPAPGVSIGVNIPLR